MRRAYFAKAKKLFTREAAEFEQLAVYYASHTGRVHKHLRSLATENATAYRKMASAANDAHAARGTAKRNITVRHGSRKKAKEAAAHAHKGKPRPTPKKSDTKKRKAHKEAQKYKKPESHPNSDHPESHFHDSDKSQQDVNVHHTYPQ